MGSWQPLVSRNIGDTWAALRLRKETREQSLQRIGRKAQRDCAFRRIRGEKAGGNGVVEHAPRCAPGQSGDARDLAAPELAPDERLLQEPGRLGLERRAAVHENAHAYSLSVHDPHEPGEARRRARME